ncbi:peptidase inhibitor family I36 protein [Methylobacterium sp. E-005]|uniref:peptidase inhibitor family I36 protein n=1 Tax=Methylobacterium sp. E-005 TaxID=2836549 RepID=UPI001FB97113|nr:peptidase inhibitor family I36 protein [Methylobacterium sp. E-005]MCJ2086011.1 peptidase inhibitor family I36 protein [Methylobacterium sp. E-005]
MTAIVLAVPAVEPPPEARRSYAPQLLLAAGWIGLFAYCATYLTEDMPFRTSIPLAVGEPLFDQPEDLPRRALAPAKPEEPTSTMVGMAVPAAVPAIEASPAPAPAALAAQPAVPVPAPRPAAEYVGTWGPTAEACGTPSRRQGYLPATITPERARAGATLCTFHDTHRSGNAWTMAADCADRDRRWSSRVRLVVEGDHLTSSSAWGTSAYIRCGRRTG